MKKIKFEELLEKESAHNILWKHIQSKITLDTKQLDIIIQKRKTEN